MTDFAVFYLKYSVKEIDYIFIDVQALSMVTHFF